MSCNNKGVTGRISNISQNPIVKGSDGFIITQLVYKGNESTPYPITGFVGATGFFENDDGTVYAVDAELYSADMGMLRLSLASSGTELLEAGDEQSFEVSLEDGGGLLFVQFDGKLQVNDRLF